MPILQIINSMEEKNENRPYPLGLPLSYKLLCESNFYTMSFVHIILVYDQSHVNEENIKKNEQSTSK
jgi:hypothetical protein